MYQYIPHDPEIVKGRSWTDDNSFYFWYNDNVLISEVQVAYDIFNNKSVITPSRIILN